MKKKLKAIKAIETLYELTKLKGDWDSYDAIVPKKESIIASFYFISNMLNENTKDLSIVPTENGHIQFEWFEDDFDIEVEVTSINDFSVLIEHLSQEKVYSNDKIESFDLMKEYIEKITIAA